MGHPVQSNLIGCRTGNMIKGSMGKKLYYFPSFQNGSAINGVTVLNGQPPSSLSAPYEGDVDNEKWWWVCCLEFCFCLL